jgi:hypothetical protein
MWLRPIGSIGEGLGLQPSVLLEQDFDLAFGLLQFPATGI